LIHFYKRLLTAFQFSERYVVSAAFNEVESQ